jgi:hypothetical protein
MPVRPPSRMPAGQTADMVNGQNSGRSRTVNPAMVKPQPHGSQHLLCPATPNACRKHDV